MPRTCEDMHRIDVRALARVGILDTGSFVTMTWRRVGTATFSIDIRGCPGSVELIYHVGGESICESIELDRTPCNYGGERPWFTCPNCGGRCAVLYAGERFWCRSCHALNYQCQMEHGEWAGLRRVNRARKRLKADTLGTPPRPKGMWRRIYDRQLAEYHARCAESLRRAPRI